MAYSNQVKSLLLNDIQKMAESPEKFAVHPEIDFTRNRKINLSSLLTFLLAMRNESTGMELIEFSGYSTNAPSVSAFYQQRRKLSPEALPHLLSSFNSHFSPKTYRGLQLIACDGSSFNIHRDPTDQDTFYEANGKSTRGFNLIHVVPFYDILSRRYLDAIIQPGRKKNEYKAVCELTDRLKLAPDYKPLIIVDRGLGSYNFYAHAFQKGVHFLARIKDLNACRLLGLKSLPEGEMDQNLERILTRSMAKKNWQHPEKADEYRHLSSEVAFDFLPPKGKGEYIIQLRFLRVKISDGNYENLVTSLPRESFSIDDIKDLYHLRWKIETSFSLLKYALCAKYFHSKKYEYICQEVWARLVLYNFCSVITSNVTVAKKSDRKYEYQINYSVASKICHQLLRYRSAEDPPLDIEGLISSLLLPIRPGRNFPRLKRFQLPMSFTYR